MVPPPCSFKDVVDYRLKHPPAPGATQPLFSFLKRIYRDFDTETALVGGVASTVTRSASFPLERMSLLFFRGTAKSSSDAWKQVKKAPYLGFRHQVKAAVGGSFAFYAFGFGLIDRDKSNLANAFYAGIATAVAEQPTAMSTARYYRAGVCPEKETLSLKAKLNINAVMFGRHFFANQATLGMALIIQQEVEEVLPLRYKPLAGLVSGVASVKAVNAMFYNRAVALSVATSLQPEQSIWKSWKQIRPTSDDGKLPPSSLAQRLENIRLGGLWRTRHRIVILSGVMVAESIWRNFFKDKQ